MVKEIVNIIDADFITYLICYNKKDSLIDKTLEEIYKGIDDYVNHLLMIVKPSKYILFLSPKKTFRNDVNSNYKVQRKPSDICFLREAKEYLKNKHDAILVENLESDDCCLILEKLLKDKYKVV